MNQDSLYIIYLRYFMFVRAGGKPEHPVSTTKDTQPSELAAAALGVLDGTAGSNPSTKSLVAQRVQELTA